MTVATLQKLENAGFDRKQAVALVDEMERAHFVLQVGGFPVLVETRQGQLSSIAQGVTGGD